MPGIKVVIADTPLPNLRADLIVCGGAGARESWFEASRSLAGPRYAILRPEFSAAAKRRAQGLADDSGVIDFRHLDGHMLAADIAALMCSAEGGISYAGMRAMELACVGVPSVLVVQADNQEYNARALTGLGAAVISSSDEMAESLAVDLMGMPEIRGAMSRAAAKVTDGLGCSRVVEYLNRKMRGVA